MAEVITWIFFILGLLLIVTELFIPGFVVLFLGLSALLVAGLRALGIITGLTASLTIFFITSIIFLIGIRHFLLKYLPSESHYQMTDEDVEAVGSVVEVVTAVNSLDQTGRIRFGGTTWPAMTREGSILPGEKAKLLFRDNLIWTVESINDSEKAFPLQKETEKNELG